jgi:hypothetical protein
MQALTVQQVLLDVASSAREAISGADIVALATLLGILITAIATVALAISTRRMADAAQIKPR